MYTYRPDVNGEPHKAPWFRYKNSAKVLKKDVTHLTTTEYIEALQSEFINEDSTHTNDPFLSSLPSLSLEQYRHNPNKLSVVSQIYHDLLYDTKTFDVNPISCCNNNKDSKQCIYVKKALFT